MEKGLILVSKGCGYGRLNIKPITLGKRNWRLEHKSRPVELVVHSTRLGLEPRAYGTGFDQLDANFAGEATELINPSGCLGLKK